MTGRCRPSPGCLALADYSETTIYGYIHSAYVLKLYVYFDHVVQYLYCILSQ